MRITDMRGVDLARTSFDFDLTFAALLMHPDGHVYHRYGGRDERGAGVWLSLDSLERVLADTLAEHEQYSRAPSPPAERQPLRIEELPSFKQRDEGECVHCHSIFPAFYEEARAAQTWTEDQRWVHPPPGRIGLDLERDEQSRVRAVTPDSPAQAAGLAPGDRLLRADDARLSSASDLSQVLHDFPAQGGTLRIDYERDGEPLIARLELAERWKRGTPREFSWRPFKWVFTPAPGFGGPTLTADQLRVQGLKLGTFALKVSYIVTWGENRRYGREAERAGLRKGDIVLSAAGERDFDDSQHFHAWWRLKRQPGEKVAIEILRAGTRKTLELVVLE